MSNSKILHLIDSAGMYGAEKVLITLLTAFKDTRHEGILGCIRDADDHIPAVAAEAKRNGIGTVYFTMSRGFNPLGIHTILKFIRDNNIELVHSHGYKPNIFFSSVRRCGFKVITTAHGWSGSTSGLRGRIYQNLDALALRRMDRIVAVSDGVLHDLVAHGIKINKIDVIPNGIVIKSMGSIDIAAVRRQYELDEDDFILGCVGRLEEVKGHRYIIEAMPDILRTIPHCKLLIAGGGPLEHQLLALIEQLGLSTSVKLIGYHENIEDFISMLDLFVMPSIIEGLPMALLEAMSSCKPVLASAVGGIPTALKSLDSCLLVPPADSHAIAVRIKQLAKDATRLTDLGKQARHVVEEKFSSERMVKQYASIYSALIP
jgi:glycosyltransferase involved in cell wall biosynthesis